MTLGFFSGTLTPSQWHDGVALLQRRSGIILPSFTPNRKFYIFYTSQYY